MDDGEVVAAIAAGDPGGLAAAYDTYAASLYGYCRWMLRDPGLAAEAVRETFVAAAAKLGGLKDASQLRARLYATARDDCYRRLRTAEPGFDEGAGEDGMSAGPGSGAEQAVVRRVLRGILAELKPEEHEVIELSVRHGLDESELATVLEVSWSRAHTLASQAREHLEKAIDALLIARTGRQSCPELGVLLAGWDGKLTVQTGKVAAQHIETCEICAGSRHGSLRPEVLARLLPLPALPPGLREPVLERAARSASRTAKAPLVSETVVDLIPGPVRDRLAALGPGRLRGGFGWGRLRGNPGAITAVAAVTLWVVAAMSATLITVTSLHSTRALAAQSSTSATPPDTPAAGSELPANASPSLLPSPSASTTAAPALAPTFAFTPTALPSKPATPAPSASATASASASASPSDTSIPTPTPAPTHTRKPTPSPTPTPTPTPTDTPTPTTS
jgi:RNA polymerase sigma factor (sigma-70 family)